MDKLAEIKAALGEFDTAFQALTDASTIETREAYHRQLGKLDILTTTDWLRDLLSIVEAARALSRDVADIKRIEDEYSRHDDNTWPEWDSAYEAMFTANRALETALAALGKGE